MRAWLDRLVRNGHAWAFLWGALTAGATIAAAVGLGAAAIFAAMAVFAGYMAIRHD